MLSSRIAQLDDQDRFPFVSVKMRFSGKVLSLARSAEDICLIVQVEKAEALDQLDEIAAVPGVDALFAGPADLAASLGFGAEQTHPDLVKCVIDTLGRIKICGKPAGLLTGNPDLHKAAIAAGVDFLAMGVDVGLLARASLAVLRTVKPE